MRILKSGFVTIINGYVGERVAISFKLGDHLFFKVSGQGEARLDQIHCAASRANNKPASARLIRN